MLSRSLGPRRGIVMVAASVAAGAAFVISRQRKLLYMPTKDIIALPSDFAQWKLKGDDITATAADGVTTRSWLIDRDGGEDGDRPRPLLVYFHGNAGPSNFCRTLFRIARAALHSYGPDPHSC